MSQNQHYKQLLLELANRVEALEQRAEDSVKQAWIYTRDWLVETGEATEEEARRASWFLKRDLSEALNYLAQGGQSLSQWLGIDWQEAEQELLQNLQTLADKTQLEWLEWQEDWAHQGQYQTGDLVLGGLLTCHQCGTISSFNGLTELPVCPVCQSTQYRRITATQSSESN